ncbi:MAG: hypothetical protein AAGA76_12990 [Pseudomonadota bacterium]
MANFEGLIRGALAAKDATSQEVRHLVYQSSRNALKRLIEENRSMTLEYALSEQKALEDAINRIEEEFTRPKVQTPPVDDDPLFELKQILAEDSDDFRRAQAQSDAEVSPGQPSAQTSEQPVSGQAADDAIITDTGPVVDEVPEISSEIPDNELSDNENLPLEFARRRKSQRFAIWLIVTLAIIGLLAWLAYYLFIEFSNGNLFGFGGNQTAENSSTLDAGNQSSEFITILEPGDLSSLVTANRGQAEIVNELNLEMVRIVSVRDDLNRSQPAKPILLRLKQGVLEQISGKNVTFEIYAKSGSPSPAQFTVKCQFGELGSCGRKRFRVGLQPEASIFAFEMRTINDPTQNAYIAINTDTTDSAATTGRGDVIDVVYARLRAN